MYLHIGGAHCAHRTRNHNSILARIQQKEIAYNGMEYVRTFRASELIFSHLIRFHQSIYFCYFWRQKKLAQNTPSLIVSTLEKKNPKLILIYWSKDCRQVDIDGLEFTENSVHTCVSFVHANRQFLFCSFRFDQLSNYLLLFQKNRNNQHVSLKVHRFRLIEITS